MYKPVMDSVFPNKIFIHTYSPKPEIIIWYARISNILQAVLSKTRHQNFKTQNLQPRKNELFEKQDFSKPFFSSQEINTINGFKALKKQIEWISGRYLIKQMIQKDFLKNFFSDQITLSYHEKGAPFITDYPDIPVSLSHSNDYTAAACCTDKGKTIGIDIEKVTKKPDINFLRTAFTKNEIANLTDRSSQIFTNWTVKEAYLKYIKKGFNESLHKVEVINSQVWHHKKKINVDVHSIFIDDYVLSLVSD